MEKGGWPMIVLGIDPGTAITGYGVVDFKPSKMEAIRFGVIRTSPETVTPERLKSIYCEMNALINTYNPACMAVEQLFFNKNVTTALAVGQARGVILLAAAQRGIPVAEYTPLQVKQAVVGYGRAEKRQIQEMVRILLKLESLPKPDDAADALAIAICHSHSAGSGQKWSGGQCHGGG
jgi:crossover junction endodeoxyribonuclease RuvC